MREMSKLGWLIVLVKNDMWADSLYEYIQYLLLLSISKILAYSVTLTWGRKQLSFRNFVFFSFLEYRTMDKVLLSLIYFWLLSQLIYISNIYTDRNRVTYYWRNRNYSIDIFWLYYISVPYRHLWADCLDNVGPLTSHNPIGLQGLLRYSFTLLHISASCCLLWIWLLVYVIRLLATFVRFSSSLYYKYLNTLHVSA
jgi:hypothetical protein